MFKNIIVVSENHYGHKNCAHFENEKEFIKIAWDNVPESLEISIEEIKLFLDQYLDDYEGEFKIENYLDYFYKNFYESEKKKYPNLDSIIDHLKNGGEIIRTNKFGYLKRDQLFIKDEFDFITWAIEVFSHDYKFCRVLLNNDEIESYIKNYESNTKIIYPIIPEWIKELCEVGEFK